MRIILLTLFVLFARVAEAQDYLPMLTDGKEWHCMEDVKYSLRDGKFPLTIKVVKDTIVGNQTCKLICEEYTDSVPDVISRQNCWLAYERDSKIYRYDLPDKNSVLLLDFSLRKGDIATEVGDVVAEEDTIYCYGQYRRRLRLSNPNIKEDVYWVEGIGSNTDGGLIPMQVMSYVHEAHIIACYENGKLVFDENCFTSKTAAIDGIQMDAEQNGKVYDLSGRMVSGKRKGVYIQDGRKYVSHP